MNTKEQEKPEEGVKNIVNEKALQEIAKSYLYIGGKLYKKSLDPISGFEILFPITPLAIIDREGRLYPKEIRTQITDAAPHYLSKANMPSHVNYQECIVNEIGDRFFNEYRPLKHVPSAGSWTHIEELLRHIFGEQYEMGLDYMQLLYLQPLHSLPVILLVSKETGTGKSTFCKFVNAIFGENALPLTMDILESRFNSYWTGKLVVYVEEQESDGPEDRKKAAKLKLVVTSESLPSEGKGTNAQLKENFVKVIICSNNEHNPVRIEANDTRYWVRKVQPLPREKEELNILDECKKEIPAFLHFLLNRTMHTERKNRLWFSPDTIRTDAWRKIVAGSQTDLERGIVDMLGDIMDKVRGDKLMYSFAELLDVVRNCQSFSEKQRRNVSRTDIIDIVKNWGLEPSRRNKSHNVWYLAATGEVHNAYKSSKAIEFPRQLINGKRT